MKESSKPGTQGIPPWLCSPASKKGWGKEGRDEHKGREGTNHGPRVSERMKGVAILFNALDGGENIRSR